MSGHNKWQQIRHKKGIGDQKKGRIFSKLANKITVTARSGANPVANHKLQAVIDEARTANMPKEKIERAIKRVGDKNAARLEELAIEVVGPESLALIITAITDNKNRIMGEIRNILSEYGYKIAGQGAVLWMFDKKGREFIPKYPMQNLSKNSQNNLEELLKKLDDNEDIQEVYDNTTRSSPLHENHRN